MLEITPLHERTGIRDVPLWGDVLQQLEHGCVGVVVRVKPGEALRGDAVPRVSAGTGIQKVQRCHPPASKYMPGGRRERSQTGCQPFARGREGGS